MKVGKVTRLIKEKQELSRKVDQIKDRISTLNNEIAKARSLQRMEQTKLR